MRDSAQAGPGLVAPVLHYVASVAVDLGEPLELGPTAVGNRRVIPIAGGTVRGPLLTGTVVAGGADWQAVLPDGTAIIDARYTLRVVDSTGGTQLVSISTAGVRTGPVEVLAALHRGEPVDPREYYFRFAATAFTSSRELDWLTKSVLVATAARTAHQVRYDLYRLG